MRSRLHHICERMPILAQSYLPHRKQVLRRLSRHQVSPAKLSMRHYRLGRRNRRQAMRMLLQLICQRLVAQEETTNRLRWHPGASVMRKAGETLSYGCLQRRGNIVTQSSRHRAKDARALVGTKKSLMTTFVRPLLMPHQPIIERQGGLTAIQKASRRLD